MFWYCGDLMTSGTLEMAIDDPGLLYGATVFTTLRIYHGLLESSLTNWVGHCQRLKTSLEVFNWQEPDWQRLRLGAEVMMGHWPVLRIAIFPDGREWITGRLLPTDLAERQEKGIRAWRWDASPFERSLRDHKTGNYLVSYLALEGAKQNGAQEAILLDAHGNWLETSTGNLWGWRDGQWWTPPLKAGILPGLMRETLIHWLQGHQKTVREESWTPEVLQGFEALGYSNSVVEVVPIREVLTTENILTYDLCHARFQELRGVFLDPTPKF